MKIPRATVLMLAGACLIGFAVVLPIAVVLPHVYGDRASAPVAPVATGPITFDAVVVAGPASAFGPLERELLEAIRRDGIAVTIGDERVQMCEACRARCSAAVDAFLAGATETARPR